jgi:hypothetical protein
MVTVSTAYLLTFLSDKYYAYHEKVLKPEGEELMFGISPKHKFGSYDDSKINEPPQSRHEHRPPPTTEQEEENDSSSDKYPSEESDESSIYDREEVEEMYEKFPYLEAIDGDVVRKNDYLSFQEVVSDYHEDKAPHSIILHIENLVNG